jgi:hypothetical protein
LTSLLRPPVHARKSTDPQVTLGRNVGPNQAVALGPKQTGVLTFWRHDGFWLAAVILHSLFWTGAGVVHVREIVRERNRRADNMLPAVVNFLVPPTLIILYVLAS